MAKMTISGRYGEYDMDLIAIRELQRTNHAGDAECIFERFAPHVLRRHRCDVWLDVCSQGEVVYPGGKNKSK